MTRATLPLICAALLSALSPPAARAATIDETIVFIECTTPGKAPRLGSGVIISAAGQVLTAKHVVFGAAADLPDGTVCMGAMGNAKRAKVELIPQAISAKYDAVLLKLPEDNLPFKKFCKLEPRLLRTQIIATGFPLGSKTGVPSSRVGVLSTVLPDLAGMVETDSATTTGMSGGMVTLAGNENLIGLVSGVDADPSNGLPATFKVLAVQALVGDFAGFGLQEDAEGCAAQARSTGPLGLVDGRKWQATDPPLALNFSADDGFCYIVAVWGDFDDPRDIVEIALVDGAYFLRGEDGGSGPHGAFAECRRD